MLNVLTVFSLCSSDSVHLDVESQLSREFFRRNAYILGEVKYKNLGGTMCETS